MSLRWDPEDDRRYAHRWRDPDGVGRGAAGTEWGANRLAFRGSTPLLSNAGGPFGKDPRVLRKSEK